MITFGLAEMILGTALVCALVSLGAFISSRLNNRAMKIMKDDMEHMKNNMRVAAQAIVRREAKEDARTDLIARNLAETVAHPRDVTIVNSIDQPVPVTECIDPDK